MKNEHKHFIARLLVWVFLVFWIGFRMSNFVVDAATWDVWLGMLSRNNQSSFLNQSFWNANPTTGDIITALYGSGNEWTIYTSNWTGYNAGSCLTSWMNVAFTWVIPTTISAHTIYVISSGTYNLSAPITMNNCSALISSGTVLLSGNTWGNVMITATDKQNIIIEKIQVANSTGDGVQINTWTNFCINETKYYNNGNNGLSLSNSSYGQIRNTEIHDNWSNGLRIYNTQKITIDTITIDNNGNGILFMWSSWNSLSWFYSYDNGLIGVQLAANSHYNTLNNWLIYDNRVRWLSIISSNYTTWTNIDSHNNDGQNIFLSTVYGSTLSNIIADNSAAGMWIYLSDSTGNILSWVVADGNYYAWVHLYNSSYNTWINIVANSNEGWLYMENSPHNTFDNISISNSMENWVVFVSGSDYTTLSWLVSSGNMWRGVYWGSSKNNTISYSSIYDNFLWGIFSISWNNNSFEKSEIYGNTGSWITVANSSWMLFSTLNSHDNRTDYDEGGEGIEMIHCIYCTVENSTFTNDWLWVSILYGHSNTIDWVQFTWDDYWWWIALQETSSNTINNTNVAGWGMSMDASIHIYWWTWNIFTLFSGSARIIWMISSVYIYNSDINNPWYAFDSYTKANNYIYFLFSPYASLTWNIVAPWSIFNMDYDSIQVGYWVYTILSGVSSLTISWNNRDWKIYPPIKITTWTKLCILWDTWVGNTFSQIYDTIEVVSWSTSLIMSWWNSSIRYRILSWSNGIYLKILKSTDWQTWSTNTSQSGCILDASLYCQFTTTWNIKLFAFWTPWLYFTGTTASGTNVTGGWYYNTTWITITFTGYNISWAVLSGLNGNSYYSGTFSNGKTVTGEWTYQFVLSNILGNSIWTTFTIDTTNPTLTGVTSGGLYSGNITITWLDTNFYGFLLNGTGYTWSSLLITGDGTRTITGYDYALNHTTWVTFTIDKTAPRFTWYTMSGTIIVSWGYYNTGYVIDFSDLHLSGAILDGTWYTSAIMSNTGIHTFFVTDTFGNSTWMTFTIDMTKPTVTGNYPTSGLNISGGNIITFSWSGFDTNMSGYTLYVSWTSYPTTGTNYPVTLWNWSYTWHVLAMDRAGNTWVSATIPFTITTPLSGTVIITWTNIQYVGSNAYTKNYVGLYLRPYQPCTYTVTGDIITAISSWTIGALYVYPYLSWSDGAKNIYVTFTNTSWEVVSKIITVYLDTTAPSIPTLTSPISGGTASWVFTLTWSASTDAGVGISWYQYFVSTTGNFSSLAKSGFTTSTSAAIANMELGTTGTFYRYVKPLDILGNSWVTAIQSFIYSGVVDTTPDTFSFNHITSALLDRIYGSNTVTITWLSANTPVLASINRWVLYISGTMVGTTGYVQNWWTVKIELVSSSDYDDDVTSILTIGGVSTTFRITTETEEDIHITTDYSNIDTNLSNTAQLQIIAVFEALRDLYTGDRQDEFLDSLLVMLQAKIDDLGTNTNDENQREALQYLYDLADQYRGNGWNTNTDISHTSRIINWIYTAPNGKKYTITYDSVKKFTSTNFITPKYYPTLDVLKYDIDRNNPAWSLYLNAKIIRARWWRISIDGTWQTSAYTAPNRKVYYFFKTTDGQYSSYTFTTEKYFDSLEQVKESIYNSNR